jgi:bifunctional DNase/RNase
MCGSVDASVMFFSIENPFPTRPLTHDVMVSIATSLGGVINYVIIHDVVLETNTYLSKIMVDGPSGVISIDARPSDAISLAIRSAVPIFVSEKIIQT